MENRFCKYTRLLSFGWDLNEEDVAAYIYQVSMEELPGGG